LLKPFDGAAFFTADESKKETTQTFGSGDGPLLYYINEYGRISFTGNSLTLSLVRDIIEGKNEVSVPDLSEKEIIYLIESCIKGLGINVAGTEKLILPNRAPLFVTKTAPLREGVILFSFLESRLTMCDVCHDSHFIYIFDQDGVIRDLIPVQLTKLGNVVWEERDAQKMRDIFSGRSLFDDFLFDPEVDAVTSATMTSSLIFEAFNAAKIIFGELKEHKFRSAFWKTQCFENVCRIKQAIKQNEKTTVLKENETKEVKVLMPENEMPKCPLQGSYIILDSDVLCTVHGFKMGQCGESSDSANR
jgi:hypothetical protein